MGNGPRVAPFALEDLECGGKLRPLLNSEAVSRGRSHHVARERQEIAIHVHPRGLPQESRWANQILKPAEHGSG